MASPPSDSPTPPISNSPPPSPPEPQPSPLPSPPPPVLIITPSPPPAPVVNPPLPPVITPSPPPAPVVITPSPPPAPVVITPSPPPSPVVITPSPPLAPVVNPSPPPPPPSVANPSPPPPRQSPGRRGSPPAPGAERAVAPAGAASGSGSGSESVVPLVIAVVAGAGLLLVVVALAVFAFTRKKKKAQPTPATAQPSYGPQSPRGNGSNINQQYAPPRRSHQQSWPQPAASSGDHVVSITPTPSPYGGWSGMSPLPPPPPPPELSLSAMSVSSPSTLSGSTLLPPPPPPPHGFTKSVFGFDELAAATGGFAAANLLGQGGFGLVHKGVLPNGKEIAVKSLKAGSSQGGREFQAEVEIISRVHHRHLVSLAGYCIAGERKMLVYEFLPNNSLEFHLHGKGRLTILDWPSRLKIAIGSAKGLAYLHEDCHPHIIHRDIKTSNILLDYNFEAKVADFGLAKLSQDNFSHVSTRVMGTFGYLAPEYAATGKLTDKSDVFSFGVVLLELITGRHPAKSSGNQMEDSLVDWARPLCLQAAEDGNFEALADPLLERNYNRQEMARMVACAAASIRHSARRRPRLSQIVRTLEGDASLEDLDREGGAPKPVVPTYFRSGSSDNYEPGSYISKMNKLKKKTASYSGATQSQEYDSSEYGATSEYGLDPSSSSAESSPDATPSASHSAANSRDHL